MSELNTNADRAVRRGISGFGHLLGRLRLWQKAGLVLCLVSWLASALLGVLCRRTTDRLTDQAFAGRWSAGMESAQVSSYFAENAFLSEDSVSSLYAGFMSDLQAESIALSEQQIENGASLADVCYCGMGTAEITSRGESLSVSAIGVGGDFFNFHPLELMSGYYFSQEELMQDRILLDDETAWRLFGSPYVVGLSVEIGGVPHYIAGVFRRPEERFYKESGMGDYLIFLSYDSLCKYTESGIGGSPDAAEDEDDFDMSGAFVPADDSVRAARETGGRAAYAAMSASGEVSASARESASGEVSASGRESGSVRVPALGAVPAGVPRTAAYAPPLPAQSLALSETIGEDGEAEEPADDAEAEEAEKSAESEEPEDDEDGVDLDRPSGGTGRGNYSGSEDSAEEAEEVNRSRISCYEIVLPEPVSGFALRTVRSRLSQAGYSGSQVSIVDNTSRYDTLRLASLVAQPGVRSMQTAAIRYPYWENVALAWEDVLIPLAILTLVLRFAPFLFLLYLLLWYATHRSWTLGDGVKYIQDRIYERQSERLYGKPVKEGLPDTKNETEEMEKEKK